MDWNCFNTHGEDNDRAFEIMCNLLFERWCRRKYKDSMTYFATVNGSGGDGGVEAYAVLDDESIVAVQSKWFRNTLKDTQINEIRKSIETALSVRPKIVIYVVCIPRDLTSKKRIKGGQTAQNTEENRWNTLKLSLESQYPSLKLKLWNETRILEELQREESTGSRLYWFENTEISENLIEKAFLKAKERWANTNYVSELYVPGYIHEYVSQLVGSRERSTDSIKYLKKVIKAIERLQNAFKRVLELIDATEPSNTLRPYLESDIALAQDLLEYFKGVYIAVFNGDTVCIKNTDINASFSCTDKIVNESMLEHEKYFHNHLMRQALTDFLRLIFECELHLNSPVGNKVVFLGDRGTGKTFAIIGEVERLFKEKIHLPILIRASEFRLGDSWKDIITKSLGLSENWEEGRLFQALETTAFVKERNLEFSEDKTIPKVRSKIVICVDGLDESYPYTYWQERVRETLAYQDIYKRIRFVFLTRPYAFEYSYEDMISGTCRRIPYVGDVGTERIFDAYASYFNIDIGDNLWIREMLDTPLSVKLFCELYKNEKVVSIERNHLVITNLFKRKIETMDSEYSLKSNNNIQGKLYSVLITLSNLFTKNRSVQFEDIGRSLPELGNEQIGEILIFLSNHGFIFSYRNESDDILNIPETLYSWGMQPAMDYLIACQLKEGIVKGLDFKEHYEQGVYQMLSILMLEDQGKLFDDYQSQLAEIETDDMFDLICYSLSHSSPGISGKYKDYVISLMKDNPGRLRSIVNSIILPSARFSGHLLGINLLDEYLRSYTKPAERDIWWSAPTNLNYGYGEAWYSHESIEYEECNQKSNLKYDGYPLLYCWLLSSVDNKVRYDARIFLTEWGIDNPREFYKLFKRCADVNDPQIQMDLFSVAFGIALYPEIDCDYLSAMSSWILENVFSEESRFCNADILYYSRGIVDIAIDKRIIDEQNVKKSIISYFNDESILPLAVEATTVVSMGGYYPIHYDLARYVLCSDIERTFFYHMDISKEYTEESKAILEKEKEHYGLTELKPYGFVISAAYQYILEQGWDKRKFLGTEKQERIDTAISGTFSPATHGEQSVVMTVSEKYVWCAKSKILAYLACRTQYHDYEAGFIWSEYFAELKGYLNPYQDLINEHINNRNNEQMIHVEKMAVIDNPAEYSEESIINWMRNAPLPDFEKWISGNNGKKLLYTYTNIENEEDGIEELIIVSVGLVEKSSFEQFLLLIDADGDTRTSECLNVEDFYSGQSTRHYCTPSEACILRSRTEDNNEILFSYGDSETVVYKGLSRCLSRYMVNQEKEYHIPGEKLRNILGIVYGDGYTYRDDEGNMVCNYTELKNETNNSQYIMLADEDRLKKGLSEYGYELFWLFRVMRSPSNMARERFSVRNDADHTFLVWHENTECRYKMLDDSDCGQDWNLPFTTI